MDEVLHEEHQQENKININKEVKAPKNVLPANPQQNAAPQEQKDRKTQIEETLTYLVTQLGEEQAYAQDLLRDSFKTANVAFSKTNEYKQEKKSLEEYRSKKGAGKNLKFTDRVFRQNRAMNVRITGLAADRKFWLNGDNDEMKTLKKSINLLQGMLRGSMKPYLGPNGKLDADKFGNLIDEAFQTAIDAANLYIDKHPDPSTPWGKRRRNHALEMRDSLTVERILYSNARMAIEADTFVKDMETIESPQDLLQRLKLAKN